MLSAAGQAVEQDGLALRNGTDRGSRGARSPERPERTEAERYAPTKTSHGSGWHGGTWPRKEGGRATSSFPLQRVNSTFM